MKRRVPIIEYSATDYSIKCPQCGKPITLRELELDNYCVKCGSDWNKFAYSLHTFYLIHSPKLLKDYEEYHKDE